MNRVRDCDMITWAKSLGLRVENENFINNSQKLVCPTLKPCWRHLIKNVKPRGEVAMIRKQLLYFNLQMLPGSTISKKINNLTDYKFYKENKILKEEITSLDARINEKTNEIKNFKQKIESNGLKKTIVEREEEDYKKHEAIVLYSKSLIQQKNNIQLFRNLISRSRHVEDHDQEICQEKIVTFWNSLHNDQEIEEITQLLTDCLKINIPSTKNFKMDFNLINEIEKIQREKVCSIKSLENIKLQIENDIKLKKDRLVAEAEVEIDQSFFELWNKLLDAKIENIRQQRTQDMIQSFLKSKAKNQVLIFHDQLEKVAELQNKMDLKKENIKFHNKNYAGLENYFLDELKGLKNDAENLPDITEFRNILNHIKQLLREIKERVLEMDLNSSGVLLKSNYKAASQKLFTINSFEKSLSDIEKDVNFSFELKKLKDADCLSKMNIIRAKENENLESVTRVFDELRLQLSIINDEVKNASISLEFWMNPPVSEYLPNAEQYQQLRERYKTTLSELKYIDL